MPYPPKKKFVMPKMMDFTRKVQDVVASVVCEKHSASLEEPCWWIHTDRGMKLAVCNGRTLKRFDGVARTPYQKKETR